MINTSEDLAGLKVLSNREMAWRAVLCASALLVGCRSSPSGPDALEISPGNYTLLMAGSAGGTSSCRAEGFTGSPPPFSARASAPVTVRSVGADRHVVLADTSATSITMALWSVGTSVSGRASGMFSELGTDVEIHGGLPTETELEGVWDESRREGMGLARGRILFRLTDGVLVCPTAQWRLSPR